MKRCFIILTVFALALVLAAGTAFAGAFRIPESGAAAMAQGNAFVGQADDPSAVHHNPGAITGLEGNQFMSGINIVTPSAEFDGTDMKDETFYIPYLFYTNHLGEGDWWLGLGVNTPFGLGTEWAQAVFLPAAVTKTSIELVKVSPVFAYKASENFSIGFGPEYVKIIELEYKGALQPGPIIPYSLIGDGDAWGFTLGGLYEQGDVRIGFAWHSGVTVDLTGDAISFLGSYTGPVAADVKLPDTYAIGINYRTSESFSFNVDVDHTQWSDFDKLDIKNGSTGAILKSITENWEDVTAIRIGGSYYLDENWTLRAGYLTEPSPLIEASYDPRLPDSDATAISVGFGYDKDNFAVNGAFMAVSKDDRVVDSDEPGAPFGTSLYDGTYKASVNLFSADVTLRF